MSEWKQVSMHLSRVGVRVTASRIHRSRCGLLLLSASVVGFAVSGFVLPSRSAYSDTPPAPWPSRPPAALENAPSAEEAIVELGRKLFFDRRLSKDNSVSCAHCHQPEHGWSTPLPFAGGVEGQLGRRHVPSLYNIGLRQSLFWDGRVATLREQVLQPIEDPHEMGMPLDPLLERLAGLEDLQPAISATGRQLTKELLAESLAAFCETIVADNTPFDRYRSGDVEALSPAARRGHDLFFFGLNCATCHTGSQLTDEKFHNLGIGMDSEVLDLGRYEVTRREEHRGAFRTPSLRNVASTAPYMHDGRFESLEEVIDFYAGGGISNPHLDPMINVLPLDDGQKMDLILFLREGFTSPSDPAAERSRTLWEAP